MIQIYDATNTAEVTNLTADLQAGATTAPITLNLWNNKDGLGGEVIREILLIVYTEDPAAVGNYLRSGVPPQDELWHQLRVTGHDNTNAPTQQPYLTDWIALGAYRVLRIPDLHPQASRQLEIRWRVPGAAQANLWTIHLEVAHSEHAQPLPGPLALHPRGILPLTDQRSAYHLVRGGQVTPSAIADDQIHVAAIQSTLAGQIHGHIAADFTLDQNAADHALAIGEKYYAALSIGPTGVTATKSTATTGRPSIPAGHADTGLTVQVSHQPSGTSQIDAADITGEVTYGRSRVIAGQGLEARVHPGEIVAAGTHRVWSTVQPVSLSPTATNHLWQLADGTYTTTTALAAPAGAVLLAELDTDATTVLAVRERQRDAGPRRALRLRGQPEAGPGQLDDLLITESLQLEQIQARLSDAGGGTAGQTVLDFQIDGTTVYTSHATEDHRPVFAFDAGSLVHTTGIPELTQIPAGAVLSLHTAEHPTGGAAPAIAEITLLCR